PELQPHVRTASPAIPVSLTPGSSTPRAPARGTKEASRGAAHVPSPGARAHSDPDRTIAVAASSIPRGLDEARTERAVTGSVVPPKVTVNAGLAVTPPPF